MRRYEKPLSPKRRLFLKEYLARGFNGRAAALAVYNCKPSSAASIACEVLKDPRVKKELTLACDLLGLDAVSYARQLEAIMLQAHDWMASVKACELYGRLMGLF
ncbi:terminase small subunit [Nitrospinae bacterium AH_259_B05_G02_I21]|nr:terminase small subunit [Nitrospinae bacterium AH_259_B05_G02_I21]MDA2932149.1 terminase small subunit [Nitrospinae bacterium AH-259-F20]